MGWEVEALIPFRECWKIVDAYERTHVPVMLLENCVYAVRR